MMSLIPTALGHSMTDCLPVRAPNPTIRTISHLSATYEGYVTTWLPEWKDYRRLLNIICDAKWQENWTLYNDNTGRGNASI